MSIEKVAITRSKGIIGRILAKGLGAHFQITPVDLPQHDLRNYEATLAA